MPERIQLSRAKGWRMPPNTVSVARPGRWGNPFYVSKWRDAATCVALFRNAMHGIWNPDTSAHCPPAWNGYAEHCGFRLKLGAHPMDLVHELRGKSLACWCKPGDPCHGDVLLELANAPDGAPAATTLDERIDRAAAEIATWPQEKLASMQLQGHDPYGVTGTFNDQPKEPQ